ncbi:MAG TPA: FAD:protein FMN transferase [Actinomycetota bacterium]|nr:FAD:protein FMN transferase [Actinomycetota bacterium]
MMEEGRFRAMGSDVSWWAERDASSDLKILFEEVEECCSRFREESELSRLNRCRARSIVVTPLMAEMLRTADSAYRLSEGRVDPTVLPAVRAAGYDEDLSSARKKTRGPVPVPGWNSVALDGHTLERPSGVELDLGGIAKGWTARAGLEVPGVSLVDAGGDIAIRGRWVVDVEHGGEIVAALAIEDCGVATSGIDHRRWTVGHHLIDPATGAPTTTDVLAATVVARDLTVAETVARTMVLMGMWQGLGWAEGTPAVLGALVTTAEGTTISFPRTREVLA